MTYQRNICLALLTEEPLDDVGPDAIVDVQVGADDDARDQHDHRSLNDLRLARPLDFLELAPRLGDEAPLLAPLRSGLALDRLRSRPHLSLPRAGALRDPLLVLVLSLVLLLRLAARAALRSRLPRHG